MTASNWNKIMTFKKNNITIVFIVDVDCGKSNKGTTLNINDYFLQVIRLVTSESQF